MANNIVLNPQAGNQFAILSVVKSTITANGQYGPTGFTTYTATSAPAGLQGKALIIAGFVSASNNGTFVVLGQNGNSLLLNNSFAVAETHTATASFTAQGTFQTSSYASKIENLWTNQNGDNVVVNTLAGDLLVAVAIGLRQIVNFDQLHGSTPAFGYLAGLNDFNASPTISDQANGVPVDIISTSVTSNVLTVTYENPNPGTSYFSISQSVKLSNTQESALNGQTVIVGGLVETGSPATYTGFSATLVTPNFSNAADTGDVTPIGNTWSLVESLKIADSDPSSPTYATSALWSLDGFFPSIFVWVAPNVKAGSYNVNLNSMFQPGITAPQDWASGSTPIFDGGVNFQVFTFSGCATASPVEASSISTGYPAESTTNPATAPSMLTVSNSDGDALIAIGLMKSGNVFSAGTTSVSNVGSPPIESGAAMTQIGGGKLVGSEAHYMVEYGLVTAGTYDPNFTNPLGYPMLLATLAIKSS